MTYGEYHRSSNNRAIGNGTKIYEDHAFVEELGQWDRSTVIMVLQIPNYENMDFCFQTRG